MSLIILHKFKYFIQKFIKMLRLLKWMFKLILHILKYLKKYVIYDIIF